MAEHELSLDDERKLVRATVHGELSKSQGLKLVAEARTLAVKVGYGILWDVTHANLQVRLADFYFLPRELDELQKSPTRNVKVALLVSPEAFEEYRFYEDVADNVGLIVKVFRDEDEAVTWMK